LFVARGRLEDAVTEFRHAMYSPTHGYTRTNYELGRALLALGRPSEAAQVLEPALRGSLDASNLYITRTELHALLGYALEAAGVPDRAAVHFRKVVAAWSHADPEFQARRDAIADRLRLLASSHR
jgi:Flp pilus assembly protein TadD